MILFFKKPETYPEFGDYIAKVFPYEALSDASAQLSSQQTQYSILMKLSGDLRSRWEQKAGRPFTAAEISKILFAFAARHIQDVLKGGGRLRDDECKLSISCSMPDFLPFDLEEIPEPEGAAVEIKEFSCRFSG